jgi:hypothetical protein
MVEEYVNKQYNELPGIVAELLEKQLLERGFGLRCRYCNDYSWYPAERVGQQFECMRCFQTQTCTTNPLWFYKLPEVVFQAVLENAHVPLLALHYVKTHSKYTFEYEHDAVVKWKAGSKVKEANIDILCLADGKLYIGEAKSNDKIETAQFEFYDNLRKRVPIDGLVFATSTPAWNASTQERIDRLRASFPSEVLVLTEAELYADS